MSLQDIVRARQVLQGVLDPTPLLRSHHFSKLLGSDVYLKLENMQRTGSFKIRGAFVKIASLSSEERARGVIAASAGNHAQGVALAATSSGIPATIVMPETASLPKVSSTRNYGAEVVLHGDTYDEAYAYARKIQRQRGLTFIHPFDDWQIIAGQGTVGLEIVESLSDVDVVIVPVGGGGLIAGIATAVKSAGPNIRVIGVQAAGVNSCYKSFKSGTLLESEKGETIADGIAVRKCGRLTFSVIERLVDDMALVEDDAIVHTVVALLEGAKVVVEPAGAVGLAALLAGNLSFPNKRIAVVLSGGNIDASLLARLIEHGLTAAGRYLVIRARLLDKPGQLMRLVSVLSQERVNIVDIEHHRAGVPVAIDQAEVELTLEARDPDHCAQIMRALEAAGFEVWREW